MLEDSLIPRYEPTYSFGEINRSLIQAFGSDRSTELESILCEYFQVKHAFLLNSGKASLFTILRAWNQPGKVVTPAYNCNVVPEAAAFAGYSPFFVDAEFETMNVPHEKFRNALTDDVSVIFAVSLFGIPYDVRPLKEIAAQKKILMVEDAASAMGSSIDGRLTGTIGDVGVISFQDTKPLSAQTGGAILTNDDALAQKIHQVLQNIQTQKQIWKVYLSAVFQKFATRRWLYPITRSVHSILVGEKMYEIVPPPTRPEKRYFSRCSPFSVELIRKQWAMFGQNISRRRKIAGEYRKTLVNHPHFQLPAIPPGVEPSWIQFPLLVKDKHDFYKYMQRKGIDITWTYRYSCAQEYSQQDCPNAEKIARSILSLPCYPDLTDVEVQRVCKAAAEYTGPQTWENSF